MLVSLLLLCLCATVDGVFFHMVSEGHIGIYYRWGKLMSDTTTPGLHLVAPVVTWPSQVLTRPQTDIVRHVECTTNDGLKLNFANIDVGNTLPSGNALATVRRYGEEYDVYLVKDKIRHQIAVICSNMTAHEIFLTRFDEVDDQLFRFLQSENDRLESGLQIDFVRLAKPTLPKMIAVNYEQIATEKTMLKVELEKQARLLKEAETSKTVAIHAAETQRRVAEQESLTKIQKMKTEEELDKIKNRMKIAESTADGEARKVRMREEASALKKLLAIPGYLELKQSEYLKGNQKLYYGNKWSDVVEGKKGG
eukprot:TRINITY_DN115121_c0_g1_i1.p1 TRINITY_DN115121_c0_g1~~TRINITY_DN115121_c0_g1_i1.p1  ORF type:complete len:309 (-),score=50.41 TRINITY_DN115121_c0_g1_i1:51-977(-)